VTTGGSGVLYGVAGGGSPRCAPKRSELHWRKTMEANLTTAIVSASATALVAITAILSNNKRLDDMGHRMDDMGSRMGRLEQKLDHIEELLVGYCVDVARIKERLDIK